jgi:hypothetical protein
LNLALTASLSRKENPQRPSRIPVPEARGLRFPSEVTHGEETFAP